MQKISWNIESLFIVSADFLKAGLIKHIYNVGIGLFQMAQCGLLCVILKTNAYGELKCPIRNVAAR